MDIRMPFGKNSGNFFEKFHSSLTTGHEGGVLTKVFEKFFSSLFNCGFGVPIYEDLRNFLSIT